MDGLLELSRGTAEGFGRRFVVYHRDPLPAWTVANQFPGIPITSLTLCSCTEDTIRHVFRSATSEEIPLLHERIKCLREASRVLCEVCQLRPRSSTTQSDDAD